jgi:hypothetical protein
LSLRESKAEKVEKSLPFSFVLFFIFLSFEKKENMRKERYITVKSKKNKKS